MKRLSEFIRLTGRNWLIGRELIPLLNRLGATETGIVLDVGCGESPFRDLFVKAESYFRLDRYPSGSGVIQGEMRSMPIADRSTDMVLLFQALTDVPDMARVMREIRRVLRPGGRVLVFESTSYPEHDAPHDFYRLMPQGLRFLAAECGLTVDELVPIGGLFARLALLWNNFLMERLSRYVLLRPVSAAGIVCANVIAGLLDAVFPSGRLCPDYLAVLRAPSERGPLRASGIKRVEEQQADEDIRSLSSEHLQRPLVSAERARDEDTRR